MILITEIIGYVAASITTFAWVPQIIKIIQEKSARDISILTTTFLAMGALLWLIYGIFIKKWPIILSNLLILALIVTVIGLKIYFENTDTEKKSGINLLNKEISLVTTKVIPNVSPGIKEN